MLKESWVAFGIHNNMGFFKPNHDRYACSDVLILLLGASYFLASTHCCLHVYKAFQVQPKASLHFSANCLPSEATSTSSGRIFDQGPPPKYLQTLCHTYHCNCSGPLHKNNISYKHCTSPSISLFYIIFMITRYTMAGHHYLSNVFGSVQ